LSGKEKQASDWPLKDQIVRAISFAPDASSIATGDSKGNVVLRSLKSDGPLRSFTMSSAVIELSFSPNGELLLIVDSHAARLIDVVQGQTLRLTPVEFDRDALGDVLGARFSPNGQFVVIYGTGNRTLAWDVLRGSRNILQTNAQVNEICFTNDSSQVLTMAQDGTAQIWSLLDVSPTHKSIKHPTSLTAGAFSPDGRSLVLCGDDDTARVYQVDNGRPVTVRLHHNERIRHAHFISNTQVLTATAGAELYLTNLAPVENSIEQLETLSRARCGYYIDAAGIKVSLTRSELWRRCQALER